MRSVHLSQESSFFHDFLAICLILQFTVSRRQKTILQTEVQKVSTISFGCFVDFGSTLPKAIPIDLLGQVISTPGYYPPKKHLREPGLGPRPIWG